MEETIGYSGGNFSHFPHSVKSLGEKGCLCTGGLKILKLASCIRCVLPLCTAAPRYLKKAALLRFRMAKTEHLICGSSPDIHWNVRFLMTTLIGRMNWTLNSSPGKAFSISHCRIV